MLLLRGFLEDDSKPANEAGFKSFYLTLAYRNESGKDSKASTLENNKKFLLSSVVSKNHSEEDLSDLKNKKLSLNVIKNIRDINGYEDERKAEKISTKLKAAIEQEKPDEYYENITRIEVAPSGEFVIQLSKDIEKDCDLLLQFILL